MPWVHPGLNSYSKIEDHYHIQGLPNRFAAQGSKKYEQPMKGNKKFNTFPNWDKGMLKLYMELRFEKKFHKFFYIMKKIVSLLLTSAFTSNYRTILGNQNENQIE